MGYKRLRTQLKGFPNNSFEELANAFEASIEPVAPVAKPEISQPRSNYNQEIENIRKIDAKLGLTFDRLNKHQRHAVFHQSNHVLLSAMVGSGKTTVLIAKVFHLHFVQKIPFDQMVVLTFTNKAAREIKERIATFLGKIDSDLNEQLRYFGTFHAIARQLLHDHPDLIRIGFKPGFMIIDEQEKQAMLERIITQENLDIKYQNKISKRWRNFKKSGKIVMGNMKYEDDLEKLITLTEAEKQKINTMDFDDLITHCNSILEQHSLFNPKWIIVDEFQDCNKEQLQLIENLKSTNTNIFVVGDQNQSIYGWRGSKDNIFQDIQHQWNATWMELPENYRSTGTIISAAETLLSRNSSGLIATRNNGTPITLTRHFDDQQEAFYLREHLLTLQKENVDLNNVAILFRTHQQIKIIEQILSQANIPFQLVKQSELHENPVQSFLLKILKLIINPNDFDACLSLICDKTFGALKRSKKIIQALHDREENTTVLAACQNYLTQQKKKFTEHLKLLEQIRVFKTVFLTKTEKTGEEFIDFLNIRTILKPTSIHHFEYISTITQSWEQISKYMKIHGWGDHLSVLHVVVDQIVLEGTFQINDRIKTANNGVHLLTIHASKGLEFDRVYIAGVNTGIIPLKQFQQGSENLKEEKRLLFVAMTRGKNEIEIGWHAQPTMRNAEPEPSYFLNAIPESLLKRGISTQTETTKIDESTSAEWEIAFKVKHKKYGLGFISAINNNDITCTFKAVGDKTFSKAFAKALLIKVDSLD